MTPPSGPVKLAPLSDAEKDAVLAHRNGADLSTISALTGLGRAAIEKAVERDKLIRLNGPKLAPLSPLEAEAVRLHGLRTPTAVIAAKSGLTFEEVRAAIERDKLLRLVPGARNRPAAPAALPPAHTPAAAVLLEPELSDIPKATSEDKEAPVVDAQESGPVEELPAPAADTAPAPPEPVDDRPAITIELGPVGQVAPSPIEELLARAEASLQTRVRTLAAAVRTQLAHLASLLNNDEKVRVLSAATEVLRGQLAKAERELAELLGGAGAAPDTRTAVDLDAALADTPAEAAQAAAAAAPQGGPGDAELAHSAAVRAWAKSEGWAVGERGRMPGAVVAAYRKAKLPGGSS